MEYPEDTVIDSYPDFNPEEAWVFSVVSDVDDIIQKYGTEFFIDHLPRYSKIALLAWRKQNACSGGCSRTGD